MEVRRKIVSVDVRGRAYLSKLGFDRGVTVVADPVEGEELARIFRPGRVVSDAEFEILADPARGNDPIELT